MISHGHCLARSLFSGARTLGAQLRDGTAALRELQLRGIKTVEATNRFLREHYIVEFIAATCGQQRVCAQDRDGKKLAPDN